MENPTIIYRTTTIEIDAFSVNLISGPTQSPVLVEFTYPSGTSYTSHTASYGTFDGTTWIIPVLTTSTVPPTLDIIITVDDVTLFTASDRTVTGTVDTLSGEASVSNNEIDKVITNIVTCDEIEQCESIGALDYSLSEQFTGRHWLDGTRIYIRTFSVGVGTGGNLNLVGSLNTYFILDKWAAQEPGYTDSIIDINITEGGTFHRWASSGGNDTNNYITLEYMKSSPTYVPSYTPTYITPTYTPASYIPTYGSPTYFPTYLQTYTPSYLTPTYTPASYAPSYAPNYTPSYGPIYLTPGYTPEYTPTYLTPNYTPNT